MFELEFNLIFSYILMFYSIKKNKRKRIDGKKHLAHPIDLTMPLEFAIFIHARSSALDSVSARRTLRRRKYDERYIYVRTLESLASRRGRKRK